MMIVAVMTMLIIAPGYALAQGPGHQMGMRGGMGPDSGSRMQMQGMMQQMGGMMQHMADRIQAGLMTPEDTKQMGEMMGHMAEMMNKLSGMMGGGMMSSSGQAGGTMSADTPQQMQSMMERMTEMHKRMSGMMAHQPAPQATPQQEKK
jgi:hypothetical protein